MSAYYDDGQVTLHHGDALTVARSMGTESVNCIVTSPPYYGLRDYGEAGQIGAEGSVGEYVANMVTLFHELRRVLADDGTLWVNLGDSYASSGGMTGVGPNAMVGSTLRQAEQRTRPLSGLPVKNLLGVPWRVAFALQADGWILRSEIIWAKPNPMPESVTDRPTKSHETIFLLAKSPKYFYDAEAIRESDSGHDHPRTVLTGQTSLNPSGGVSGPHTGLRTAGGRDGAGRNKRTVWTVPTTPFPGAHFAVYPPKLIRPCILAGSRIGDTVLDPFSGSGTTGMVATEEGRKYVGIDLNSDYLDLSLKTRFAQPVLAMGSLA
jgi:DNA modification methylase